MRSTPKLVLRGLAALGALLLVMLVNAPASFAAPTLSVSATTGLADGQTITISGSGFEPNLSSIAIGQCIAGYTGPADCNTSGGATFKNADASGKVASFTIVVKEKFGSVNCLTTKCVIAAAPLPTNADAATIKANTYVVDISFASAESSDDTSEETTSEEETTSLPKTGAGDSMPVIALAATALLASGIGLMLLVPGRRREGAAR